MRKLTYLILILILTTSLPSFSQKYLTENFPIENGKILYTEVVSVDSTISSEDLYISSKKWINKSFNSAKSVVQTDDKSSGLIIVKSYVEKGHNSLVSNPKNWFLLTLEFKQGRFRYKLTDIIYELDVNIMDTYNHFEYEFEDWVKPDDEWSKRKQERHAKMMHKHCKELSYEFESIISSLKISLSSSVNDEW